MGGDAEEKNKEILKKLKELKGDLFQSLHPFLNNPFINMVFVHSY
jgi:hypothetical protein